MPRRVWIGGLLAASLLLAPAAAGAATLNVTSTDDHTANACDAECTLRDAVTQANDTPGADTIVMPAGTYSIFEGPLSISSDMTIAGPIADAQTAIVNFTFSQRDFDISSGAVTISHLRVHGGEAQDSNGGSGVFQHGGTVTLDHDVFDTQTTGLFGGALLLQSGTLNIADTEVVNATAYAGGGLYVSGGTANVDRSLFYADGHNTGGGGAIYNSGGTLNVTNSSFVDNEINAGHGGAIYSEAGRSTTIRSSTFLANVASGNANGGNAIWADGTVTTSNNLYGPDGYQDNCAGSVIPTDQGGSLDSGASCGLASGASNQTILLGPLEAGGGATRSLVPWAGSAGVNAGSGAFCPPVDQRGAARSDGMCDVGAVEGQAATTVPPPLVSVGDPQQDEPTEASVDVLVDRRGVATSFSVESGTTTAYGTTDGPNPAAFGTDAGFQHNSDTLANLADATTYHYRVDATNAGGTTVGPDETIKLNGTPYVATEAGTTASTDAVTLNGTVNPAGAATTYHFEYGPTAAYGSATADGDAGNGIGGTAVTAALTGLTPSTTVHYRVVATNASGTVTGDDGVITSVQAPPTPTPTPVAPPPTPTATPAPTPAPTPQFEKTVVVEPVSGKVLVQLPGSKRFVQLDAGQGIPDGSTVDTRNGKLEVTVVTKAGKKQSAKFFDGLFRINQNAKTTDLTLTEALAPCPKSGRASAAAKKPKSRKLWGDGSGNFRTRGHYSAATVRGTTWLVQDTCAGTLTRVTHGVVSVRDNVKHITIVLRAGKHYLARPKHKS